MKKKYIRYRLNLLIGLLSLNALPSCVSTSQAVRPRGRGNQHIEEARDRRSPELVGRFSFIRNAAGSAVECLRRTRPETLIGMGAWFAAGWTVRSSYNAKPENGLHSNATTSGWKW